MTTTTRKQKDHERYMRDRERRLAMQREWDNSHPGYHREYVQKRVQKEIEHQKYLKELTQKIWNLQTQT